MADYSRDCHTSKGITSFQPTGARFSDLHLYGRDILGSRPGGCYAVRPARREDYVPRQAGTARTTAPMAD
ncbi:MAG: hypothetical protein E6J34_22115 [Chloroflexi bacterium]|nr:MAG: hypothetical protein E6J34_22115 [Chloroflexota bacterium]